MPSISDTGLPDYTVVGGDVLERERKEIPGLSIILLNRGGRPFREDLFDQLCRLGAREVISVEISPSPYDVDALSRKHERLRFLILATDCSPGLRIDAAMREAVSDHVFVLWNDMAVNATAISSRVFAKISDRGRLCTVPMLLDPEENVLPSLLAPRPGRGRRFEIQPMDGSRNDGPTLAPWDFSGIYRRERHLGLGGFDPDIQEPWWQLVEYGMRAWLWGQEIRLHTALKLSYTEEPPAEDTTPSAGYRRFYLKTLAVRVRGDGAYLPGLRYFSYKRHSGEAGGDASDTWKTARRWVRSNRLRYTRDAASLTELWDWDGS